MTKKTKWGVAAGVALIAVFAAFRVPDNRPTPATLPTLPAQTSGGAAQPSSGRVTMIDLGATECIPCKMMAPILEELKEEYKGKADILFKDVWKDPSQAKMYGVQAIPTRIFFDSSGREVYRHVGFINKEQIMRIPAQMGVVLGPTRVEVPGS